MLGNKTVTVRFQEIVQDRKCKQKEIKEANNTTTTRKKSQEKANLKNIPKIYFQMRF